jgi:phosphatidate cytidylyltransferase
MLKERIATAIVLLGVFLSAVFFLQTGLFAILIGVVVAVGSYEWARLCKLVQNGAFAFSVASTGLFSLVVWGLQATDPSRPGVASVYGVVSLFWILAVPIWLRIGTSFGTQFLALTVGTLVVVPAGLAIVSVHSVGPGVLVGMLVFIWLADTAAYFSGRRFGRHKLAPLISPGKTWEGAAGALMATLIYASICPMIWPQWGVPVRGMDWVVYLSVSALLCAISIVGDLFESSVKRHAGVKDSGTILPGHGGVLDRIDSITSTLPLAALIFYFVARGG